MKNLYDLRSLQRSKHLRWACLVLFGALHSFQVTAQTASLDQAAYDRFMWTVTGGNSQTVSYGTGGQPVVSPAGGNMPIESASSTGSEVGYSGSGTKTNPSGNKVPIGVRARILGTAAAKIIGAGMGVAGVIGAGKALWDLCNELGYKCSKGAAQPLVIQKQTDGRCYVANSTGLPCVATKLQAARDACRYFGMSGGSVVVEWFGEAVRCDNGYLRGLDQATGPSQLVDSSLQELEDSIAQKSGWPTSSTIHKAIEEAAKATGQKVPLSDPKVTGPATSPGTTKTTVDPAKNTTTTTGTVHNHYYNDNRVTTTTTTSVNTTNNTTGTGETTTTTEEPVEQESECQKNPDSIACAQLDTPEGEIPKVEKLITFNPENLGFGGGSCPANVVQTIAGKPVTIVNWSENCTYITTYAKPTILVLAFFSAMMILFAGGKPE